MSVLGLLIVIPFIYNTLPLSKSASEIFYLPSSNSEEIAKSMQKSGYTVTIVDRWMLDLIEKPQEGWYRADKSRYGRFLFFATLYGKKTETMSVRIYAGETAKKITQRLANDMKLDSKKLYKNYVSLNKYSEADIFAGRYTLARQADENVSISFLFDRSEEMMQDFVKRHFTHNPSKNELQLLLNIASIIQKESNSVREMPLISSVIYNRLRKNMKLQMDSTLNYGEFSHTIVTPERIKRDMSYYNTYKHKGLPPYPLGSVTMDALEAAMFPAQTKYLFFMLNSDGSHRFSATYKEHLFHLKAFRKYQKEKKERLERERKDKERVRREAKEKRRIEEKKKLKVQASKELNSTGTEHNTSEVPKKQKSF